jgi:PhoH-like ATPase
LNEIGITVNAVQHYRGRTYHHSFIIVDEAQNLTPLQVKTIMTRIGNGSKIVLTGDLSQIDRRFLTSETSGLAYAIAKMAGNPMVAVVKLIHTVRSKISAFAEKVL